MINKTFTHVRQKGFTILEAIVAIAILSVSVSGAFSAVQQSLSQATIAKDEVRAFYLAQEGVEIVRNIRDKNQLAKINGGTDGWLFRIAQYGSDPAWFGHVFRVTSETQPLSITAPSLQCGLVWNSCVNLRKEPTSSFYGYTGTWGLTNFKRELMLESINAHEIAVIVRVTWKKGAVEREFKIKTLLFDWI